MSPKSYKNRPKGNRRKKKKKSKKGTLLFLVIVFGYFIFRYISLEIQYNELEQRKTQLQAQVKEAKTNRQQLSEQLDNSDSYKYIENLARKYLGLVYPDEKVYIEEKGDTTDQKPKE